MNRIKNIAVALVFLCIVALGIYAYIMQAELEKERLEDERIKIENTRAILSSIDYAAGLTLVSSRYSEVYQNTDYKWFDLPGLRRKIFIHVQAEATAGFNLDSIKAEINNTEKKINITKMPLAEVLQISYDYNYYDLESETFADEITPNYLNEQQTKIRSIIEEAIKNDNLIYKTNQEFINRIENLNEFAKSTGWKIEIADQNWQQKYAQ